MNNLNNARVLIVEDDWLQATELAHHFHKLGMVVLGPATSVAAGMKLEPQAQMAILDIDLAGEKVFPIADRLQERSVPIIFYSAYNDIPIPSRFRFASRLGKPSTAHLIDRAARAALSNLYEPADDVVEMLPKLRLAARLMLNDPRAADRLVEHALERALATLPPDGEDRARWLTRLIHDVAQERGRHFLT
ncbi:response regulator [Aquicoccus sp. SCR17]|nr:response regulator [Carideicomes alvinocaridis]